ncbi:MAG: hypothetical protein GF401_05415 [Chitinivibrionales bacterium]|nr:hypothetical protein [Chitinivibrionales bacterium]
MLINKLILFIVFLTCYCFAGFIRFEGPAPTNINRLEVQARYAELYKMVAPSQEIDRSPLVIRFYNKRSRAETKKLLPEWGGGGAVGDDLIVIPVDSKPFLNQSFTQIIYHELVHILLKRAYPSVDIPRWFHEGIALSLSGELSINEHVVISRAIFTGSLVDLDHIDSVNMFSKTRADLAYCQSHQAVQLLIRTYGMEVIPEILGAAKPKGDFERGMYGVLGLTEKEFEKIAEKDLQKRYSFVFIIADTYLLWAGIMLLFIVGLVVTRIRNRKKLEEIGDSEDTVSGENRENTLSNK